MPVVSSAGAEMNTPGLEYNQILEILGNGDIEKGSGLLQGLSKGLLIARQKRVWGKDNETNTRLGAYLALWGEINEWDFAVQCESRERQDAEALDVLVVATRIAGREWE